MLTAFFLYNICEELKHTLHKRAQPDISIPESLRIIRLHFENTVRRDINTQYTLSHPSLRGSVY